MFAGIVSRAMTVEVLSTGVAGNYNGALQVVHNKTLVVKEKHHFFGSKKSKLMRTNVIVTFDCADDSRISSTFTSRANSRELFRKVLQTTYRWDMGSCGCFFG